ncbi:MAG: response regulator transcription factor [Coprococcus sp.]|nr:response regulator transcription factor [Coprococcus sp.]
MMTILIVEDDSSLAIGLCRALQTSDVKAESCDTMEAARKLLTQTKYDLIILDVNLPDGDGFSLLAEIKSNYASAVIMLTANDLESDIVSGLEQGADDYVTKPFSLAVLRARVQTQLRNRKNRHNNQNCFVCDDYVFDFDTMEFYRKDERLELSKTEQKLLKLLTANAGMTLTRDMLLDRIWTDGAEYVVENALSVTVKRLRDKLDAGEYIKTIYGVGYQWTKKS